MSIMNIVKYFAFMNNLAKVNYVKKNSFLEKIANDF